MKTKTVGKMATALMVLIMVLSSVMVLHTNVRAEERRTGTIEGVISAEDDSVIPADFNIMLKDISDNEIEPVQDSSKGGHFYISDVDVGHYKIIVPSQAHGDKAYLENETGVFSVEANEDESKTINIPVREANTINGTIEDESGDPVFDATVSLSDGGYSVPGHVMKENVSWTETNDDEAYYEVTAYNGGSFTLKVDSDDHAPTIKYNVAVSSDMTKNITLRDGPLVSGFLKDEDTGEAIRTEKDVTLINKTNNDIIHSVSPSGSSWFSIEAQEGDYKLVVNAEGYQPYTTDLTIPDNQNSIQLGDLETPSSNEENIDMELTFGEDWETLSIDMTRTLQPDSVIPGLDYSYLGSLKMQLDMMGNGDWTLDGNEVDYLENNWLDYTENPLSTQDFVYVDDISYQHQSTTNTDFSELGDFNNDVTDFSGPEVTISSENDYMEYDNISADEMPRYMDMMIQNDMQAENFKNYSYTVDLPEGFERDPSTEQSYSGVNISGFTTVEIDPHDATGETTDLTLDIKKSDPGKAEINAVDTDYVEIMEDKTLVKQDENITFRANIKEDPVGEITGYSWLLDGQPIEEDGKEITYNFEEVNEGKKTLSVEMDTGGGDPTTAELNVTVDGTAPSGGSITTDAENGTVEERVDVDFVAKSFTDDLGNISNYEWNFTDGTPHETISHPENNITHEFELKGDYTVRMTVSDVVENKETFTKSIEVTDATDPVPVFNLTYTENGEEENYTSEELNFKNVILNQSMSITLNASNSYDPKGYEIERKDVDSLSWAIKKDGKVVQDSTDMVFEDILEGPEFQKMGIYTIELNVSDENNNSNMITRNIEIDPGAVPELQVENIDISGDLIDGNKVTVKVNVTNYGDGDADDISVLFKIGDKSKSIDDFTFHKDGEEQDNKTIPAGENRIIKFDWNIDGDGKKTIGVNVTDSEETSLNLDNNEMQKEVDIEPPTWRQYIVYILVPVIIIGVTVGLYFYRERFM